jgi:molecular chaperone DnaK
LPIDGVQPDLCVALGAAIQAGVLSGEAVDAILVDVCPHSLGVATGMETQYGFMPGFFSVIIPRNSVVPISRSEVYVTAGDNQSVVEVEVSQGENIRAEENVPLGSFIVENLPARPAGTVQIEIHFDFDINGILTVTATEKGQGNQGSLVVNNTAVQRLSSHELSAAQAELADLFTRGMGMLDDEIEIDEIITVASIPVSTAPELLSLQGRAQELLSSISDLEESEELEDLMEQLSEAIGNGNTDTIKQAQEELEDFLYYAASNADQDSDS